MYNNKLENFDNIHQDGFKTDKLFGLEFDFDKFPDDGLFNIAEGLGCGEFYVNKEEYVKHVSEIIEGLKNNH